VAASRLEKIDALDVSTIVQTGAMAAPVHDKTVCLQQTMDGVSCAAAGLQDRKREGPDARIRRRSEILPGLHESDW